MSHFPSSHHFDRTSAQLKAETRVSTSAQVRDEVEAERQTLDERTERLRAMRLARENAAT